MLPGGMRAVIYVVRMQEDGGRESSTEFTVPEAVRTIRRNGAHDAI